MVEKWLIKGGEHDPNPWKPLLLIPNDVGLGPIFRDLRGNGDEHEEHGGVANEIRGSKPQIAHQIERSHEIHMG